MPRDPRDVLVSQYYSLAYGNPADVQSEDRRRIGRRDSKEELRSDERSSGNTEQCATD